MRDDELSCEDAAEAMRKRYRYRQLILSGKLRLSRERAAQLVGPDTLYQLYSLHESDSARRKIVRHSPKKKKH